MKIDQTISRPLWRAALIGSLWVASTVVMAQNAGQLFGAAAAGQVATQMGNSTLGSSAPSNGVNMPIDGLDASRIRSNESAIPSADSGVKSSVPAHRLAPFQPNDFQKFVLETTGYKLPLYGQAFFENVQFGQPSNANGAAMGGLGFAPIDSAPVSADYLLGPGDQVLVRGWGSVDIDVKAIVDRNGNITLPRVGAIALGGVKAAQADGVIRSAIGKYYKDFDISVTLSNLRAITVYVVGQARRPGSYAISGASTLASGLFATGGPAPNGSLRHVQLKRAGQLVREFDLYQFLAKGDASGDIKLVDGDVIVFPPAVGYVALVGTVNNPAVYELSQQGETLEQLLSVAGGLPVTANQQRVTLERLEPSQSQPRSVQSFAYNDAGKATVLHRGDVLTVQSIVPELGQTVTLRGHVAQPVRLPWHEGLRVRDLIPDRQSLITRQSIRNQNESLFDANQRERARLERAQIPTDLAQQKDDPKKSLDPTLSSQYLSEIKQNNSRVLADSVGQLYDEINWDYAVIERLNRNELTTALIPFNLAHVLSNAQDPDNQLLQPGDVVTVFSAEDVRVPVAKRRVMVRIEGEVNQPGYYQLKPGENMLALIQKAGGLTSDAYLFGAGLYREEVKRNQADNLQKLIRRLDAEGNTRLTMMSQSTGASSDAALTQARLLAAQQMQKQTLERLRTIEPEGRIALNLTPSLNNYIDQLPGLRLQNGDRLVVPVRPDFIYVYGSVNTESALLYKPGATLNDYLAQSGLSLGGDRDAVIVVRADGSALSNNNSSWFGSVGSIKLMPGDSILVPDKVDLENSWSFFIRNAKDITQIVYQMGIGAAAFKALGY